MTKIYINNKQYITNQSHNLLQACLSHGFDIPYFCWHPELGSIGSCRQCAIKKHQNPQDKIGKIIMSCMTPVENDIIISTQDQEIQKFRKHIIELLMIHHPHDCPVCEEGGNCHLQDMTVITKHHSRRYQFKKRTHQNQNMGPFISHEMNRCITCYRCVRYYKDYADGNDFGVYGIHDNIYFGRPKNGTLQNEFSGNLIEICPTGVFTDKTHSENYNRKWDMQYAPSICQQCSIGCNIIISERYGKIRKIENHYHGNINHYFICDRGRFGYDYLNLKNRTYQPKNKKNNQWNFLTAQEAIKKAIHILKKSQQIFGIGSARTTIENNFALKELVGEENFSTGIPKKEQEIIKLIFNILQNGGIYSPSLKEIEQYDAILILGEDVTQTGARMALSIRQAIKKTQTTYLKKLQIPIWHTNAVMNIRQNTKNPLFITNIDKTKLDDIASWTYYATTKEQAKLGFAIAHTLDKNAPSIKNIHSSLQKKIKIIATTLANANKPLIISGVGAGSKEIISAAANIAFALKKIGKKKVGITFILQQSNSMGSMMIHGKNLDHTIQKIKKYNKNNTTLIILENNLQRYISKKQMQSLLKNIKYLIIIDNQFNPIQQQSNLILPSTNFSESSGTIINHEGRAQRFFQVYYPKHYNNKITTLEGWRWLHWLHTAYKKNNIYWKKLDHILQEISQKIPQLRNIVDVAPQENFRVHGKKLARMPHCYSGRTILNTHINIHEKSTPKDPDSMFTFSMEGDNSPKTNRKHIAFVWTPGWNSPQAWNKFQKEIGGNLLYGNPGIKLITPNTKNTLKYFQNIPKEPPTKKNNWYIAAYWHLFGSEETSQNSKFIKKKMPKTYVMISQEDINKFNNIIDNKFLSFYCQESFFCLPIRISKTLSSGQIGLPIGFPGIPTTMIGLEVTQLKEVSICNN
ncbi:MAG: NADH:quinone oxidoreductase subunit G [Candidatus Westeberhardia cardiocondylae]|nr:NADH:quinone oxidoreductase subunit G [Candidatus Westeberhardia cardiocondylae]